MTDRVDRSITGVVLESLRQRPVTIIEGARAVGKTSLVARLLEGGHLERVVSMTDDALRGAAERAPLDFVRALPMPFAIDEAQLVPDLPRALKSLMDERGEREVRCILTGSAAVGRTGLGGSDPLARRATRIAIEPLTEAEIDATPGERVWSVVDALRLAEPRLGRGVAPGSLPVVDRVRRGGLPDYRLRRRPPSPLQVSEDIDDILSEDVLSLGARDRRIAREVIDHVLRNPSGELKAASIGSRLGLDARTVNAYLDIATERFLVHELENLEPPKKGSPRITSKAYPADIALSSATLLKGSAGWADPKVRGALFEAHVVQQVRSHAAWALDAVEVRHARWTQSRTMEVDLVLDAPSGAVGIEVKATHTVKSEHLTGLRKLRERLGARFVRGFVITEGGVVTKVEDGLWAIPVAALYDASFWTLPEFLRPARASEPITREDKEPAVADARIFMSYAHDDQGSAYGGNLRQFAEDVVDALEGLHERNAQLFIDTRDGRWGEDLWDRLDRELESSTFLMPFITPRYLRSDACRDELRRFLDAAGRRGSQDRQVLPLVWVSPRAFGHSGPSGDDLVESVRRLRYIDVGAARAADRQSREYREAVEQVAQALAENIDALETAPDHASAEVAAGGEPVPLDELLELIDPTLQRVEPELTTFLGELERLGDIIGAEMSGDLPDDPPRLASRMKEIGGRSAEQSARLDTAARGASDLWTTLMNQLNEFARTAGELGEAAPPELIAEVRDMARQIEDLDFASLELVATQMSMMSSHLGPASRAIRASVHTLRTMGASAREWADRWGSDSG